MAKVVKTKTYDILGLTQSEMETLRKVLHQPFDPQWTNIEEWDRANCNELYNKIMEIDNG